MRLMGKYIVDKLIETFQGSFGYSYTNGVATLDLWQLHFEFVKNTQMTIYIKTSDGGYEQIGKIMLS